MASSNLASGGYCSHMTEFHSDQQMPQSRLVDSAPSTASSVDENNVFSIYILDDCSYFECHDSKSRSGLDISSCLMFQVWCAKEATWLLNHRLKNRRSTYWQQKDPLWMYPMRPRRSLMRSRMSRAMAVAAPKKKSRRSEASYGSSLTGAKKRRTAAASKPRKTQRPKSCFCGESHDESFCGVCYDNHYHPRAPTLWHACTCEGPHCVCSQGPHWRRHEEGCKRASQ